MAKPHPTDPASRLADLYRQGFMKPRRSVAAAVPKPIVACSRCSNWHVEGKHTLRRDPCKAKFKLGEIVLPRFHVPHPILGLSPDTPTRIVEIRARDKRMRVERDDGQQGSWWLDMNMVRRSGCSE